LQPTAQTRCVAFSGTRRIAEGELATVALRAKEAVDTGEPVIIFDDTTSEAIELDFRGTPADVLGRLVPADHAAEPTTPNQIKFPRGPGRPRLGVVAREVTLLPGHWEWLNAQPGGASVALRKLVDGARRANESKDRVRRAQEVAYRFMSIMAGDRPGFEEATRALFAGDRDHFHELVQAWPRDVAGHAGKLAEPAFAAAADPQSAAS